jgi:hypothetical protein
MPYILKNSNGTTLTTVQDGSVDQTTALTFVGKNYAGYGQIIDQNLLYLLQNFSSKTSPAKVIEGQLWFDSAGKKLKVYDGLNFRSLSSTDISTTQPTAGQTGDYWFNPTNSQLLIKSSTGYVPISSSAGGSDSGPILSQVRDTTSQLHYIIQNSINGNIISITSNDAFSVGLSESIVSTFPYIKQGLTLPNTNSATGISAANSQTGAMVWGTSANALTANTLYTSANNTTTYYAATTGTTGGTIAARDSLGQIWATNFIGTFTGNVSYSQIVGSLGYVPYNSANPAGYVVGLKSSGQLVISGSTALNSTYYGANTVITAAGVTVTLPANAPSGTMISLSNVSVGNVTISYAGTAGSDGPTTLATGASIALISDGGGSSFWRLFFGNAVTATSAGYAATVNPGITPTWTGVHQFTNVTAPTINDGAGTQYTVGFKTIPQNAQNSNYSTVLTDSGKHLYFNAGTTATYTIAALAYPIGTAMTFVNRGTVSIKVAAASPGILYYGGVGTTGTRTLSVYGVATALKCSTTDWVISGAGLS